MQKLNGGYTYVTCYKIAFSELGKFDIASCKEPKETLSSYYNRQTVKPTILTNGGFFGLSGGIPCFNLLDENLRKAYNTSYKYGIGRVKSSGAVKYGSIDEGIYSDFISGYPVLVVNGKRNPINIAREIDGYHPRTLLGYNDDYLFIVVVDGRQKGKPGMTFYQAATLMIKFGCKYAINLDGGGSSRMLYKGTVANHPTENRAVDNVIAIYLKSDLPQTDQTDPEEKPEDRVYTVKYGDSLWSVAKNEMGNGLRYTILADHNGISISDPIYNGDTLKIPYEYDIKKSEEHVSTEEKYSIYVVKSGDSLWSVAKETLGSGMKYTVIKEYNNLTSNYIYKGQVLKIPK